MAPKKDEIETTETACDCDTCKCLTDKLNAKLHKIMSEVTFIQKDKTNKNQGYNYASEQIIKETIREKLVENKILFRLEIDNAEYYPENKITNIDGAIVFTDVESSQMLSIPFTGQGWDSTDKGMYKAITGAIKYALTSAFLIPTGDDPEEDVDEPKATVNKPAVPTLQPVATLKVASDNFLSSEEDDALTKMGFPDQHVCPVHNENMRQFTKNNQSWFAHKLADGKWCNGK